MQRRSAADLRSERSLDDGRKRMSLRLLRGQVHRHVSTRCPTVQRFHVADVRQRRHLARRRPMHGVRDGRRLLGL
jgi:hypothetical protein